MERKSNQATQQTPRSLYADLSVSALIIYDRLFIRIICSEVVPLFRLLKYLMFIINTQHSLEILQLFMARITERYENLLSLFFFPYPFCSSFPKIYYITIFFSLLFAFSSILEISTLQFTIIFSFCGLCEFRFAAALPGKQQPMTLEFCIVYINIVCYVIWYIQGGGKSLFRTNSNIKFSTQVYGFCGTNLCHVYDYKFYIFIR